MTAKNPLKKTGDRTLIIYAHPYDGSFNHAVLEAATSALDKAGRPYDVADLYADGFDPRMPAEELALYTEGGTLDPLVSHYQKLIEGASRIIVIAPIWWSELPAIVKGFVDKVMKQNWAYHATASGVKGHLTHNGLTSRVDHPFISKFVIGNNLVVNPTEKLGINLDLELAFFRKSDAQVLWTNDNLNRLIWLHPPVDRFKAFAIKLDQVVLNHGSWQDVGLTDKCGNKVVDRLIIDVDRRS